jgi:hypothetical protein
MGDAMTEYYMVRYSYPGNSVVYSELLDGEEFESAINTLRQLLGVKFHSVSRVT